MKTLIFVPTKGPHRFRFGPQHWHDWVAQCRKAAELQRELPDSVVFVPSAVHITGFPSEYEYYRDEMQRNGLRDWLTINGNPKLIMEKQGQETIEQCGLAFALAQKKSAKLIALSTFPHVLRLLYLCRGKGVTHKIAWGIPNPLEAVTDTILAVVFPILDFCGLGERFQAWVIRHRESGKHI